MRARVGCMGISGGGTVTLFATALEPRIRAAMVSGYLNTFRDSIGSLAHCIDNYVPGILNWAEMHDVAGLIAPRPLFVESGEKDNIFPIRREHRELQAGAGDLQACSGARIASSRKCSRASIRSGASKASRSSRAICGRSGGPRRSNAELAEHAEILFSFWTDVAPMKGRPTPEAALKGCATGEPGGLR